MSAWHNEIEPYAADWTRNLITAGLLPAGEVDERSIVDIRPSDIAGYDTCHFFAGFGGWPYALRLAGWPEDRPVWTGSCPCQPFSVAGKQTGFDDPRHLWPAWEKLIAERRPPTIFGEQSSAATDWLSLVRRDLEALGYAVGCIPMEAASNDADHYRDRYWIVADLHEQFARNGNPAGGRKLGGTGSHTENRDCGLADSHSHGSSAGRRNDGKVRRFSETQRQSEQCAPVSGRGGQGGDDWRLANGDGQRSQIQIGKPRDAGEEQPSTPGSGVCTLVNGPSERGHWIEDTAGQTGRSSPENASSWGCNWTERQLRAAGFTAAVANIDGRQYIECPDRKWRRLPPPRVRWLGTGIPARISKLRAIGNAIDHRPAVAFIQAYMTARGIQPDYGWRIAA